MSWRRLTNVSDAPKTTPGVLQPPPLTLMTSEELHTRHHTLLPKSKSKTMMDLAADCNNRGVELYRQQRFLEARAYFRAAAKRLLPIACGASNAVFPCTPPQHEVHRGTTTHEIFDSCQRSLFSLDEPSISNATTSENTNFATSLTNNNVLQDTHLLFVHEAHVMQNGSQSFCTQNGQPHLLITNTTCTLHTAGIIMNIALTYLHDQSEKSLYFALNLFEIAYILILQLQQQQHQIPSAAAASAGAERIALTCLNNAAQVLFSLGNHTLSQLYLTTLVQYMRQLPIDPHRACWRGRFLLHAVILQGSPAACAA